MWWESCLRRHERHSIRRWNLSRLYSHPDRGWGWRISQEYSGWERQPHHPADTPYCQQTSDSPGHKTQLTGVATPILHPHTEYRGSDYIWKRQSKTDWGKQDKTVKWGDAPEWYTRLSRSLELRSYKAHAQGINNTSTVATHAWGACLMKESFTKYSPYGWSNISPGNAAL